MFFPLSPFWIAVQQFTLVYTGAGTTRCRLNMPSATHLRYPPNRASDCKL